MEYIHDYPWNAVHEHSMDLHGKFMDIMHGFSQFSYALSETALALLAFVGFNLSF